MSRLLALETSSSVGSVALMVGSSLTESTIAEPRQQTARLLPLTLELLEQTGLTLDDLDAVAFGRGPGSFTGLRVAAAVAHGFGLGLGIPLLPISSLAAAAQGVWRSHGVGHCLICVDARMGEVFWAEYEIRDGLVTPLGRERLGDPGEVAWLGPAGGALAGSGLSAYAAELARVAEAAALRLPEQMPRAADLCLLAAADLAAGRGSPVETALPVYLRRETAWQR
ncbi:MAG TPA: tRNA (adenosine(37)-N6)-threonylcarbamoyltransferase complex dimerization subunit type 1 TsaB [Gammaproteobacteria bacterium]|jgi:tRNA threonylcarbamoyladenosine biosynthesis protein TsaB